MSGGEIAGLIFAAGFALLVLFTGYPLIKLGKVLDESARAVEAMNEELTPLVAEARVTLIEANKQLKRIDHITEDIEQISANASSLFAIFTTSVGGPIGKIAALINTFAGGFMRRKKP